MESTTRALRRISLFASLSEDALARVARVAHARTYAPGETVIFEGDPCSYVTKAIRNLRKRG